MAKATKSPVFRLSMEQQVRCINYLQANKEHIKTLDVQRIRLLLSRTYSDLELMSESSVNNLLKGCGIEVVRFQKAGGGFRKFKEYEEKFAVMQTTLDHLVQALSDADIRYKELQNRVAKLEQAVY